jgi:heparan-alpha-glucosaminide N-acetyltransferase
MTLFAAERSGAFEGFWLNRIVGIGATLGSLPAITVGGMLLGSMLGRSEPNRPAERARFTLWFVLACSAAALLLHPLYGISKNQATPSWCFWSCAITATTWFILHLLCEVHPVPLLARPLTLAGENVLLAYLISEMLPGLLAALGWADAYGHLADNLPAAITRSALCATVILLLSVGLNRVGFRLRL